MDTQWVAPVHKSTVEQIDQALQTWNETGVFVAHDLWLRCLERARAARPGQSGGNIYTLARGFFAKESRNSVPEHVLRRIVREAARQTKRSVLFTEVCNFSDNRPGRML